MAGGGTVNDSRPVAGRAQVAAAGADTVFEAAGAGSAQAGHPLRTDGTGMAASPAHRYPEDPARCAEILRMAVPLMARQAAGAHPIAYAVWFEHLSGRNPRLSEAVTALTQNGRVLDEETTARLHAEHVAELDERTALKLGDDLRRVIGDMTRSASEAGERTDRFGNALDRLTGEGASPGQLADACALIELSAQTRLMREAVVQLQARLDENRREIEHLRSEVDRARNEAFVDGLTGLPNRRAFDSLLAAAIGCAGRAPCLIVADIDHFKRINDTYGHLFGDTVLKVIAQALLACVAAPASAARVGGEEFAILAPGLTPDGARQLADRVRLTVAGSRIKRKTSHEPIGQVTMSFGVAAWRPGQSLDDWFEHADRALYVAKATGRNRVCLADDCPAGASAASPA